jgi:hypothetical protein
MNAPFDPADWLRRFADAGGFVMPSPDGRVAAGWPLDDKAQAIWAEICSDAERRAAYARLCMALQPSSQAHVSTVPE